MKCIILAAGYATRLYPLTENFPKPLLKIKDKTILDWLVDDIDEGGKIDEYIVISNAKFYSHFLEWATSKQQKITVLNDKTTSNETRLGAVKDIEFAIKSLKIESDILVIAGDNVLDFSLVDFVNYAEQKDASAVLRYYENDTAKLRKSGVLTIAENDLVLEMQEKPLEPKTNWCCPPFYFYKSKDASLLGNAIEDGCGVDAPGSFISWLCKKSKVYAMQMPGKRYDIGNLRSYEEIKNNYKGIKGE